MSRIGKKPVPIPEKTTVTVDKGIITVKGQKGALSRSLHPDIELKIDGNNVIVTPKKRDKKTKAMWGTTRAHIANMIHGVSKGFERVLEINGVGYRAELKGKEIVLHLGFSHPVVMNIPEGIDVKVDRNQIRLSGIDKESLGQFAASIRRLRPPEPYKGKGIKYAEEHIMRKAGKSVK